MRKTKKDNEFNIKSPATLVVQNKNELDIKNIGSFLRMREKSLMEWLKFKKFTRKAIISMFAVFMVFSIILAILPQTQVSPVAAETLTTYEMAVSLNEYIINTQDSNYYAWRGKVNLTGDISSGQLTETSLVAYIDEELIPVFSLVKDQMALNGGSYSFNTQVDTSKYKRGYHTLRFYNGTVVTFSQKVPILTIPVYFEYSEIGNIFNVTESCNMRASATTDSAIITAVPLDASVNVLSQTTGQYRSDYGTNTWYQVIYENNSNVYTGFIISALVKKMATGISKMKISATDSTIEEFFPGKTTYQLNLPYSAIDLSVQDLVLYNKSDTIKVVLNGSELAPPYNSLPLITGNNKIEFITSISSNPTPTTYTYNIWRIAESTEAEFQAQLAKFPESYKPALRILHGQYPKWLFTAFDTGLDWETVISAHDAGKISLIEISTLPQYKYSDEIMDGTSFVRASRAAVEYYIDPRNFLDDKTIFQFEQLTYQKNMHTLDGIQKLLSGSGLSAKVPGIAEMFLNAGVESGVSPYHLAARSRQEVSAWSSETGAGLSVIASGTYTALNNKYYGKYNFYNIGTGSSTNTDTLVQRGLDFALGYYPGTSTMRPATELTKYFLPWDTQEKAIVGGGVYIGQTYITKGQDTLYLQKFDVDPINGLYNHEYMQNVRAPFYEAKGSYNAYSQTGALDSSFVFRVPVYLDMPLLTSPKPEDTNKLDTLGVTGYPLTPSFNPASDDTYTVNVPASTDKITITATTLNSKAVLQGTGEKSLAYGNGNTFVVYCIPTSGDQRNYTINVTRSYPESSSNNLLSSLNITSPEGLSISPAFNPDVNGPYSVTVPDTSGQIQISAIVQNASATVTGAGEKTVSFGTNNFVVSVKAENGSIRDYTLQIIRNIPKATSSVFVLSSDTIKGIPLSTTVDGIKKGVNASIGTVRLFDASGIECSDSTQAGTGMILRVYYESRLLEEHVILIYGDANGDGKVNSTDITALKSNILNIRILGGKYLEACDLNKDGKINSTDYTLMKRHILNLQAINQL